MHSSTRSNGGSLALIEFDFHLLQNEKLDYSNRGEAIIFRGEGGTVHFFSPIFSSISLPKATHFALSVWS